MWLFKKIKYLYKNIDNNNILNNFVKNKLEGVKIMKIKDKNHPVYGEYGLFSTRIWKKYEISNFQCFHDLTQVFESSRCGGT